MTTNVSHADALAKNGYCIIPQALGRHEEILSRFGCFVGQYDGKIEHEVRAQKGFETMQYSKSTNGILVHSEAPGWNPPPRYLALVCRRQARCGGGHTDLLDADELFARLEQPLLEVLRTRKLTFPSPHGTVDKPLVEYTEDGRRICRFSYNLLTYGEYDPPINGTVRDEDLPLGTQGRMLAKHAANVFRERRTSLLVPDNALLIWDNHRMFHARSTYRDEQRHLTRFWLS